MPLLDRARERVNIVTIPPLGRDVDVARQTWNAAAAWSKRNRAMLIVDPPAGWQSAADVTAAAVEGLIAQSDNLTNAALYFPWLLAADPLDGNRPAAFAPSGAICGSTPVPTSTAACGSRPPARMVACKAQPAWRSS